MTTTAYPAPPPVCTDKYSYPLIIERGATFRRRIAWRESDGTPIDLTGCTAFMQLRTRAGGALVLELTTENGLLRLDADPTSGVLFIDIPAATTAVLSAARAVYDLRVTHPDGSVTLLFGGAVEVVPAVSVPVVAEGAGGAA